MGYCQYRFACTSCGSEIVLISIEANPIICQCAGCSRVIVLHGNTLYTVSQEFFDQIADQYNLKTCGQIVGVTIHRQDLENSIQYDASYSTQSDRSTLRGVTHKEPISKDDIEELRRFLDSSGDSLEILKKYW